MSPRDKPLVWLRGAVTTPPFGSAARLEAGFLLRRLQRGELLALPHSRPMPGVGNGCHELRIVDEASTWRIVHHIAADAIVILDVFQKKTQATPNMGGRRVSAPSRRLQAADQRKNGSNVMRKEKRRHLERAGWSIGDAGDFLNLSDDERRFIETKLALAAGLRRWREHLGLTQMQMADRLGSSQSRVAKMESADSTVSTDLLLRSLFRLGANRRDIARLVGEKPRRRAA
jgi:phage-related protein